MINQISTKTRFGWISAFENRGKIFKVKFGRLKKQKKSKILKNFSKKLLKFFDKKISNINVPHEMVGNQIQKKIWKELKKIPYGKTKSYGEIAKIVKTSPRYVGKVCGQNKHLLAIPCHRVIRTDGTMGGFSGTGGLKLKKRLLILEQK